MKVAKSNITLSQLHPSLLLELPSQSIQASPIVLNEDGELVDGYRRFQIMDCDELEAVVMKTQSLFSTARALNERTRRWDETDRFLWSRWARSFQVDEREFSAELYNMEGSLLISLARGQVSFRQAVQIFRSPAQSRKFFLHLLASDIELNGNQTAVLIDMTIDVAAKQGIRDIPALFEKEGLSPILDEPGSTRRQKGERLLKAVKALRYPYYQKKLEEFSSSWRRLNFGPEIQARDNLFVERGVLDLSFSASSLEDMTEKVRKLFDSLESPELKKIWQLS